MSTRRSAPPASPPRCSSTTGTTATTPASAPPILADAGVRNDPLFGGIAWHGYFGDPSVGTQVHNQYPAVKQFSTEHSGGTWIGNQHNEDMADIVNYTRNWSGSLVKWSLALNQNMGPHNGGCGTCTGLITVQEGGSRAGQVDYTIEYYTTGHLTKFVKPGAFRIDSTANGTIQNVAWRNPDGSKALIAHNGGTSAQSVRVNWGGQSFVYTLPARTTATFTWQNNISSPTTRRRPAARRRHQPDHRPGRQVRRRGRRQHRQRHRRAALHLQRHRRPAVDPRRRRHPARAGQVPGHQRAQHRQRHGDTPVGLPHRHLAEVDLQRRHPAVRQPFANKCLDVTGNNSADGTRLQIWTCTTGANQKWTFS